MKTLYLHCGTHETGSASIQVMLGGYEGTLCQVGILVPKTGRVDAAVGAHHNLAWELSGDGRYDAAKGTTEDLLNELTSSPHSAVILSSEDFGCLSAQPGKLRPFIRRLYDSNYSINLVVYLRDKLDYAISLYGELKKVEGGLSADEFASAIIEKGSYQINLPYPHFWDFDYHRLIDNYKEALGECGTVAVRRYSRDSIGDFSDLIGFPRDALNASTRVNVSKREAGDGAARVAELLKGQVVDDCSFIEEHKVIPFRTEENILAQCMDVIGFIPKRMTDLTAWRGHIPFAAWIMGSLKPRIFVELGTHRGDSYSAFCQAVVRFGLDTRCYAVDTWRGDEHAGIYNDSVYEDFKSYHDKLYAGFSTLLRKTFDQAVMDFEDHSIDLLHIDGLHTYEAVWHDYKTWLPKLSESGVILFHDTAVTERDFGVWRFWAEVEKASLSFKFFHSHGLGVLAVGKKINSALHQLFNSNTQQAVYIRHLFAEQAALMTAEASFEQAKAEAEQARAEAEQAKAEAEQARAEAEQARAEAEQARAEAESLRGELAAVYASRSWRATRLLRVVAHNLRLARLATQKGGAGQEQRYVMARAIYQRLPVPLSARMPLRNVGKRLLGLPSGAASDYSTWIRHYDVPTEADREAMRAHVTRWIDPPKISILMPAYNTPKKFLRQAIDSVLSQIYPHWELCVADDASTQPHVEQILREYAEKDSRIKIIVRQENGHISAASNSALSLATGKYVALLDHDDLLREHALYWVAAEIMTHPDSQLLYSDEDKIDEKGQRFDPYFKPDWNWELLLAQNYICHLGVYRLERLLAMGGFRKGFEGGQDWDLVLRFTECLDTSAIRHIPAVLYHWRAHGSSTAGSIAAKPYARDAGKRAVSGHLERLGDKFTLEAVGGGAYHLPRFAVRGEPLVSILIPTRNHVDVLCRCIKSLAKTTYRNYEIVIIDNQTNDEETLRYLRAVEQSGIARVLCYDHPFNYAALHNWVVPQTRGGFLCLLNNDTEVISPEWLGVMLGLAQRPGIGAVGAKLLYPDDSVQHAGVITGIGGVAGHVHKYVGRNSCGNFNRAALLHDVSAVTAACLLVRRDVWDGAQGMEEKLGVAFNDVDFCLRLRELGLRNVWTPQAVLYHHESKSRGVDTQPKKLRRFALEHAYMQWRWGATLKRDPAYNPNLTLEREDFSLAFPPRVARPWREEENLAVEVPYGHFSLLPPTPLEVAPSSALSGSFPLPKGLRGCVQALSVLIGNYGGASSGRLVVQLSDGNGWEASGEAVLVETEDNRLLRMPLECGLTLCAQERISFRFGLEDAQHSVVLWAYPLDVFWGQGIAGHEDHSLRIVLHLREEEPKASTNLACGT